MVCSSSVCCVDRSQRTVWKNPLIIVSDTLSALSAIDWHWAAFMAPTLAVSAPTLLLQLATLESNGVVLTLTSTVTSSSAYPE